MHILLIEDNEDDVLLIQETLAEAKGAPFDLECAGRLSTGLDRLARGGVEVVLLDLSLPDSQELATLDRTHAQAPDVPIVVLTGLDDEALGVKAVQQGAQDYLVKGQVDSNLLVRAMRYAIERHRLQAALHSLSLVDELTSIYNRRGFLTLAEQQLKSANRTKQEMLLIFVDLDGMKWINDTLGHHEGDRALIETAGLLKTTFRESDIIARIGGDEFVVLAIEVHQEGAETLKTRLQTSLAIRNAKRNRRYELSLSLGIVRYDPQFPCPIEELLDRADTLMYEQKQGKLTAHVRLRERLRATSIDELTGLYNRRGFLTLAEQQMKIADRTKWGLLLLSVALDNMAWINENLGRHEGEQALIEITNLLKATFRESDIIARAGDDEFVVMAIDASMDNAEFLKARLHTNLAASNAADKRRYPLSINIGIACYDPECPHSIDELLGRAEASVHEQKRVCYDGECARM
ncbi:MAG: diguanylate cyclase [Candidatus Poribacteria bacterium]|nr:diguanylate cyclase [Candidatus Poribacteria bacterium]